MRNRNSTMDYNNDPINGYVIYEVGSMNWSGIDSFYRNGRPRINNTIEIEKTITGNDYAPQFFTTKRMPKAQIETEYIFGKLRSLTEAEIKAKKDMIIAISEPAGISFFDDFI